VPKRKTPRRRHQVDWKKARGLYEVGGKSFSEISRTLGCARNTVSARAKREGWIDHAEVEQAASDERRQKIIRDFVERDGAAILDNLERKHRATTLILDFFLDKAEKLAEGEKVGGALVDPIVSAGQMALGLRRLQIVDDLLADLKDGSWRADAGTSGAGSDPHETALQEALRAIAKG
jgi:hypothetical protein